MFEIVRAVGLRKMYGRLYGREDVLCSVFGFPSQSGDCLFALLALGLTFRPICDAE